MNRDCCAVFDDVAFISSILASKSHLSGGAGMIAFFGFCTKTVFMTQREGDEHNLSDVFCIK